MDPTIFEKRLGEAIGWCGLQTLDGNAQDCEEFRNRQALRSQGLSLLNEARLLEKRSFRNWLISFLPFGSLEDPEELRRRGKLILQQCDGSEYPLNDQLRSASRRPTAESRPGLDWGAVVEDLANRRAALLKTTGTHPAVRSFDLVRGKLLRYKPEDNFSDGASQDITCGYFDVNDAPPWDTWVCFVGRSLISWVPPILINLVQSGIDANPVDCIGWVDETLLSKLKGTRVQND